MSGIGRLAVSLAWMVAAGEEGGPRTVPIEMKGNVVFVKASVGDSAPLEMVFDSGTIRTTLDEDVARKLGLDLSRKALSSGARGAQEISVLEDQVLRLGGCETAEPVMIAYPLGFVSERIGRRVDGIIGVELLHQRAVELDYAGKTLRIWEPDAFQYKGHGEVLPVTYDRRMPLVKGRVKPYGSEAIEARFQVDSGGASADAMLWKSFIEQHGLLAGARDIHEVQLTGFTGTTTQKQGRMAFLQFGRIVVTEPEVGLNDYQFSDARVLDANLGAGFLKRFTVIFDLPHDRIILERPVGQ